jgi:hypothetical protein
VRVGQTVAGTYQVEALRRSDASGFCVLARELP